ncbi:PucR family transcriptional regulator [Caproiciproducens sp. MSJ-32]|uniref:PucR family transcriptional regulator n=1 Tax=Caproiciproducens sp. MSJ-32 TaxID=2841527 RepID=UPI001C100887|nr:helix-turn-helix domain-containing protein [Caproiciproducens sp. MSJ-32]MBU5455965.1 helix-turn-helix domain-containing protein [Caproiciproducens sp. MSJ-32]
MYGLRNSFDKIRNEIQIPFKISEKDGTVIADFLQSNSKGIISSILEMPTEELTLETYETYSHCLSLLKYCLEQELKNTVKSKEEIINDLIKGREFSEELLNEVIKYKPFKLILVYFENEVQKAVKLLQKKYFNDDSIILTKDKYIIIVSKNNLLDKDIDEIFAVLEREFNRKAYISFCKIEEYKELKEKFENLKSNIEICLRYNLEARVYKENSLLLERIIRNSDKSFANRIFKEYDEKFSKLDEDLIKTIEVFFNEGLKISESADKLYIHRNTLFYRIEKIKKLINYDISNFNDAVEFKILYLYWREMKFNKIF